MAPAGVVPDAGGEGGPAEGYSCTLRQASLETIWLPVAFDRRACLSKLLR